MARETTAIAAVLHDAAELHHAVWRDTDGEVRSHLVHALVELDRRQEGADARWEVAYARGLVELFS